MRVYAVFLTLTEDETYNCKSPYRIYSIERVGALRIFCILFLLRRFFEGGALLVLIFLLLYAALNRVNTVFSFLFLFFFS